MTLQEFMDLEGLADAEIAKMIRRDQSNVSRLRRRVIAPSIEVAAELQRISGGKITAMDLIPIRENAA